MTQKTSIGNELIDERNDAMCIDVECSKSNKDNVENIVKNKKKEKTQV